jgi:hypothetical protein
MIVPSFADSRKLDEYFIIGRNMWPDLKELKNLEYRRDLVPDDAVRFIRSTALNEYGIVHYVKAYYRSYGDDYKLGIWASFWGGEEYLHSIVLRTILEGLGETISNDQYAGLEAGEYEKNSDSYLAEKRKGYKMDARLQQLIYGVVQEYAAKVAYASVAEAVDCPNTAKLLKRMAKDEMRHCRFFQICLESLIDGLDDELRAEVFPMFSDLFKEHRMPQEHIAMFNEFDMGTDLYIKFWTPEHRSNIVIYLTNYFRKFKQPRSSAAGTETGDGSAIAESTAQLQLLKRKVRRGQN